MNFVDVGRGLLEGQLDARVLEAAWHVAFCHSHRQLNNDDCGVFTCLNSVSSLTGVVIGAWEPTMLDARH